MDFFDHLSLSLPKHSGHGLLNSPSPPPRIPGGEPNSLSSIFFLYANANRINCPPPPFALLPITSSPLSFRSEFAPGIFWGPFCRHLLYMYEYYARKLGVLQLFQKCIYNGINYFE